jgi:low molecular weight protein-tyrosine phosphatase
MAAALLRLAAPDGAADVGAADVGAAGEEPVAVISAGLLEGGHPVAPQTVKAMAPYGGDLSGHLSTQLTADAVEAAELIVTMERRHAREVVLLVPTALARTFTLKDLVRRGERVGPRRTTLAAWLEAVGEGRDRSALIGRDPTDEVADPMGGDLGDYRATAAELSDLIGRLAGLLWPDGSGQGPDLPIAQ